MAADREYSITYNGLTIPGTIGNTKATINGIQRLTKSSNDFEFVFQVYLYDSPTALDMGADVATLENKFRQPLGNLDVILTTIGGGDVGSLLDLDFSSNEAFNTEASIQKVGSEGDSARSRLYEVTITGELPYTVAAPATGQQGLREFSYDLEFSASRRAQITMTGEYTVQAGGAGAAAHYITNVLLLYDQIITDLAFGNWPTSAQPKSETRTPDKNDQVIAFTRVYAEIIYNEKIGALDDPEILEDELNIDRVITPSFGDPKRAAEEPQLLTANYVAFIDHTVNTNLKEKWDNSLRDYVIASIRLVASNGGSLALESETLNIDPVENVIRATLIVKSYHQNNLIRHNITTTVNVELGHIISKVWPNGPTRNTKDLVPTPAYVFDGARTIEQTRVTTTTKRISQAFGLFDIFVGGIQGSLGGTAIVGGSGGRKIVAKSRTKEMVRRNGIVPGFPDFVQLEDTIKTEVIELIGKVV